MNEVRRRVLQPLVCPLRLARAVRDNGRVLGFEGLRAARSQDSVLHLVTQAHAVEAPRCRHGPRPADGNDTEGDEPFLHHMSACWLRSATHAPDWGRPGRWAQVTELWTEAVDAAGTPGNA